MPRKRREDRPGYIHHVGIKGGCGQEIFVNDEEIEFFFGLLLDEVERGRIVILAIAILTNHLHAVVISLTGELSAALQRIESIYFQVFNRARRLDGSRIQGRFWSEVIWSQERLAYLIRYVELNPVKACMERHPWAYPFCSAYYQLRDEAPEWLHRPWFEKDLSDLMDRGLSYAQAFFYRYCRPLSDSEVFEIEQKVSSAGNARDSWRDLRGRAAPRVATLLDQSLDKSVGLVPPRAVMSPEAILDTLGCNGDLDLARLGGELSQNRAVAISGLLFQLAGLRISRICEVHQCAHSTTRSRLLRHRELMSQRGDYCSSYLRIASLLLDRTRSGAEGECPIVRVAASRIWV
jgi:REP element-mobilizing transposase RayT